MLYSLTSTVQEENALVDLRGNHERFRAFFIEDSQDDRFLKYSPVRFVAQEGYTDANIAKSDYIEASIGVPLVSQLVVATISTLIADDITFYPCEIECGGKLFPFFMGKILNRREIVNPDTSMFRQLTDGRRVLMYPRYKSENSEQFFIARDVHYHHLFAVSQKFVSLIISNGFAIAFRVLPDENSLSY